MNVTSALVLGILIGWLLEWAIDWFYWRRPTQNTAPSGRSAKKDTKKIFRYDQRPADADDLKKVQGVGPAIEKQLNNAGIYKYEQLAQLSPNEFDKAMDKLLKRVLSQRSIMRQARDLANKKSIKAAS
jgi:predicted flap endonuclease-1-like 5' DNA nuclease